MMSNRRLLVNSEQVNIAVKEAEFQVFLDQYKVHGKEFTHVSKDPSQKYYFGKGIVEEEDDGEIDDDTKMLEEKYQYLVYSGCRLGLLERPEKYGPLRMDLDFKTNIDNPNIDRQYTPEMIESLIFKVQSIISSSVSSEDFEPEMATCLLLEKSRPRTDKGYIIDGVHLHFPRFICENWFYDEIIRPQLIDHIIANKTFEQCTYINTPDTIVDKDIMTKQWCMYGSHSKDRTKSYDLREPYLVTNVYKYVSNRGENENGEKFSIKKCVTTSPEEDNGANKTQIETALMSIFAEEMIMKQESVIYYLPKLLSIRGYPESTPLTREVSSRRRRITNSRARRAIKNVRRPEDVMMDLKTIVDGKLMDMISPERAENYSDWMDVGWTLYCIGDGCPEARDMWIDFSRQGTSFQEDVCMEAWDKMEVKGKTMGSLIAMARKDSPREFREWRKQTINYYLYNSLTEEKPTEGDLSDVVKHLYSERFICASSKQNTWYEFMGHRWHRVDDCISLKKLFANDIRDLYYELSADIARKLSDLRNEPDRARAELDRVKLEKQAKRCTKIISVLKTVKFARDLAEMCKIQFHDEKFETKLDSIPYLFGCENGVLDLRAGIFREGRPDDYITLSCGLNYTEFNDDDEEVKQVDEYIRRVFLDQTLRDYFLDVTCACLEAGNTNKIFAVFTGEPDGGKSAMMDFIKKTFGDYFGSFNQEMFIMGSQVSSAQARPELDQSRGKRLMVVNEISKAHKFNPGALKLLTGNDDTYTRTLHSKGGLFRPQFTLFFCMNEPPEIPAHDNALWTRGRFIPCESMFVKPRDLLKNPVPDTEEERTAMKRWKADPIFLEEIYACADVFLWKLFKRYGEYKKRGLKDPEKVTLATLQVRHLNDVFLQFIRDRIEEVKKDDPEYENTFLKTSDVYQEFQSWNKENNAYLKEKWSKIQVQTELSKRLGPTTTKVRTQGWKGYRIFIESLDEEQLNYVQSALAKK
jgi:phage/plasmid-associated DNA primase